MSVSLRQPHRRKESHLSDTTFASPEAYAAVRDALIAGLRIVREHEARGDYVSGHFEFPEMGHFESGLPHFSKSDSLLDKAPRNYKSVFRDGRSPDKIPEWAPFYALARTNDRLKRYFDGAAEFRDEMLTFSIGYALEKLVDRYIHLTRKKEFDEAAFLPIYREWENAVFAEMVTFDILVPLLMVTCDFDALEVADGLSIERMAELFQLARSRDGAGSCCRPTSVSSAPPPMRSSSTAGASRTTRIGFGRTPSAAPRTSAT